MAPRTSPPTPSPVSKLDRRRTGILRKRDDLLTGESKGWGWARSQFIRQQESLVLYESFNTLWPGAALAARERPVKRMEHHAGSL
jgi:hypothetical protein